jgi:hypothetical protein
VPASLSIASFTLYDGVKQAVSPFIGKEKMTLRHWIFSTLALIKTAVPLKSQ